MTSTPTIDPSATRPLLLISSCQRLIGDKMYAATNCKYVQAAADHTGAAPLILGNTETWTAQDSRALLASVDGLLLTGSTSNIHPQYSAPGIADLDPYAPFDLTRDAVTLPLIREAIVLGIPLLAICRGHQELNVALGGTLRNLPTAAPGEIRHVPVIGACAIEQYAKSHQVSAQPSSRLREIWQTDRIPVNSYHFQAIDQLAPSLVVDAIADDGVIEAVSCPSASAFTLGVQWHPEADAHDDPHSAALFTQFGQAVRARQQQRLSLAHPASR